MPGASDQGAAVEAEHLPLARLPRGQPLTVIELRIHHGKHPVTGQAQQRQGAQHLRLLLVAEEHRGGTVAVHNPHQANELAAPRQVLRQAAGQQHMADEAAGIGDRRPGIHAAAGRHLDRDDAVAAGEGSGHGFKPVDVVGAEMLPHEDYRRLTVRFTCPHTDRLPLEPHPAVTA